MGHPPTRQHWTRGRCDNRVLHAPYDKQTGISNLTSWVLLMPHPCHTIRQVPELRTYRRRLYQLLTEWAGRGGGPQYKVDGVYLWSSGTWDVHGVHPRSSNKAGSYADVLIQHYIRRSNAHVYNLTFTEPPPSPVVEEEERQKALKAFNSSSGGMSSISRSSGNTTSAVATSGSSAGSGAFLVTDGNTTRHISRGASGSGRPCGTGSMDSGHQKSSRSVHASSTGDGSAFAKYAAPVNTTVLQTGQH